MSFFARIFGRTPQAPPRVPTDEVLPMHLFDDVSYLRGHTLIWTFKFHDILDADKLGSSLSELFETEGWRKLGGRLRLKPDGKIEVHVPRPFTPERPSLHFTKEQFDLRMSEHPQAKDLPAPGKPESGSPITTSIFPGPRHYGSLAFGPGAPRRLEDYLESDVPQFALHVVTFQDGTLVSINFNHITSDVSGLRCVLDAWQLHLAGKPEAKAEFMSVRDGMAPLYENPPPEEEQVIAGLRLSGWPMVKWIVHFLWDSWWAQCDSRTVYIPGKIMDKLLEDARACLRRKTPNGQDVPFVTEGDVLLAVAVRLAAHTLPAGSNRPINEMIAVDPRGRAKSVFRPDAAYVQNAPSGVLIPCTARDARELDLGSLAFHMREAIQAQTTEEQLKVTASELAKAMKGSGQLPMYGDADGLLATSSNWSKAKLLDSIDFSPAVVKPGAATETRHLEGTTWRTGRPVFYHSRGIDPVAMSPSLLIIMGRDHEGNMWLTGEYPDATWSHLLQLLPTV